MWRIDVGHDSVVPLTGTRVNLACESLRGEACEERQAYACTCAVGGLCFRAVGCKLSRHASIYIPLSETLESMVTFDYDVVVAGAGGGLVAALRAAEAGMNVAVMEADEHFARGNNTSMCTAMIPGIGTRWQRDAGIRDNVDLFVADVRAKSAGTADSTLAAALARGSNAMLEWLADVHGLALELALDVPYPGHSVPRCHTVAGRHGSKLLSHLIARVRRDQRIDLIVPAKVEGAREVANGIATTVRIPGADPVEEVHSRALILATSGFGANATMVAQWLPEMAGVHYHGGAFSRGDGLHIGQSMGAALTYMDAYQGHAALSPLSHTLVGWAVPLHGGIIVDEQGRRFAAESAGYSEFAQWLAAAPGDHGWLIFDERIGHLCSGFTDYRQVVASGGVLRAADLSELAHTTGLPIGALTDEIREVQRAAEDHRVDRLGRDDLSEPLGPPFLAAKVIPALFHTQGGLRVDGSARVLRSDDLPVQGLYATGGAAMGISGHGAGGYMAGNGLITALGLSWLAANHICQTDPTNQQIQYLI